METSTPTGQTMDDYQQAALRTANRTQDDWQTAVAALGLCGEAGEVADSIKKALTCGEPIDREAVALELGDTLWYLSYLAYQLGYGLQDVADLNVRKLWARHPHGFTAASSRARADLVVPRPMMPALTYLTPAAVDRALAEGLAASDRLAEVGA